MLFDCDLSNLSNVTQVAKKSYIRGEKEMQWHRAGVSTMQFSVATHRIHIGQTEVVDVEIFRDIQSMKKNNRGVPCVVGPVKNTRKVRKT